MKKQLVLAAAALALAACTGDENLNDGPVAILLSSSLEVQTRAASGIQGSTFDEGESVDIFITEAVEADESATTTYPQPLTYTTGTNGTMTPPTGGQPYFPTSGNGVNIYSYYPSGTVTDMGASGVAFTVKADQSTDAAYKASDLMFGTAANPVSRQSSAIPVTFRHLLSKITVNLTPGDGNPSLDGATVSLMNVRLDAQLTPATGTVAEGTDTQDESVTVTTGTGGSAVIPIQTVANGKQFILVQLGTGGNLYYTLPQAATFQSGKVYTYNIKVNLTDLEVTSSIQDWTDGGGESGNATDLGDGYTVSEDGSTYTVYTADGLMAWAEAAQRNLSLNCILTHDIDLSGTEWEPVAFGDIHTYYAGTFDGNGHTISNLAITKENLYSGDDCGMFGRVGTNATIKNLTLKNVSLNVSTDGEMTNLGISALVGVNQGTISNCKVSGNISVTNNSTGYAGGVVGQMDSGVIQYCHSSASVQGGNSDYVGGVLGGEYATATVIKGCSFSGSVTGGNTVGGIAGYCRFFNDMTGCYSVGELSNLSTTAYRTGGVVGFLQWGSEATACYWDGFDGESVGRCNSGEGTGAYQIDGTTHTWQTATEAMNAALGAESEYIWETTDADTPPTLVKNR